VSSSSANGDEGDIPLSCYKGETLVTIKAQKRATGGSRPAGPKENKSKNGVVNPPVIGNETEKYSPLRAAFLSGGCFFPIVLLSQKKGSFFRSTVCAANSLYLLLSAWVMVRAS